jgi:hypothetical protein
MSKAGTAHSGKQTIKKPTHQNLKSSSTFGTTTMLMFSAGVASVVLAYLSFGPVIPAASQDVAEMDSRGCPIYTQYSTEPHGDRSSGPLGLPFMRPEERCRTFNSTAVEVSLHLCSLRRDADGTESYPGYERQIEGSGSCSTIRKYIPVYAGYHRQLFQPR